ncbi:hypothetical protein DEO72_LG5g1427 [Vigna unguiculata]|uniref:Uncharacterized protein n=1 Tax=Vigna unguiculata TaxID=3917 RepID=A0A4D6LWT9_VIGUN|nr:hypothetical protein DEO72_LG5g1427 [Vigna unguiculata]
MGDLKAEITRGREGRGCKRNTGWKNQSRLSTTIFLVCFERCTNQWIVRSWCRWGFQMSFCGRIWVSRFYGMLSIWGGLGSATSILLNNLHHARSREARPSCFTRVVAQATHVAVERASISPKREGPRLSEIPWEATVPLFEPAPRRRRLAEARASCLSQSLAPERDPSV